MEFPTDKSAEECSDFCRLLIFTVNAVYSVFWILICYIFAPEYIEGNEGGNISEPN